MTAADFLDQLRTAAEEKERRESAYRRESRRLLEGLELERTRAYRRYNLLKDMAEAAAGHSEPQAAIEVISADAPALARTLEQEFGGFPDLYSRLITARNRNWAAQIEQLVKEKTGRTLKLQGPLEAAIWPALGANVSGVTFSEKGGDQQFLALDNAHASVAVMPLLRRMNRFEKSTEPNMPMSGMNRSATIDSTMRPNAAPMMTPIARSTTLPLSAKLLNSSSIFCMPPLMLPQTCVSASSL